LANAFAGNLSKLLGIEPLKLLLETFKSNKPAAMFGSGPEKLLFSKNRLVKLVRLLIENGIGPKNLLVERSRRTKRLKRINWVKPTGERVVLEVKATEESQIREIEGISSMRTYSVRAQAQEREQLGGRRGEEEGEGSSRRRSSALRGRINKFIEKIIF
jgi:hypothetical protein